MNIPIATIGLQPWEAALLGLVEGLTEFLPVSSTGHLILTSALLGRGEDPAVKSFEIVIQVGAILAVLGLYQPRVIAMLQGLMGRNPQGLKLLTHLVVAFIPSAVLGVLFASKIKAVLFAPLPVATALALGGLVIFGFEPLRARRLESGTEIEEMGLGSALIIGLCQCFALIPGTSRSLSTILGGLGVGLKPAAAAEFSFLLALPTLAGATVFDLATDGDTLMAGISGLSLTIGVLVSMVSAALAVKGFVAWLGSRGLWPFGVYRVVVGLAVWALWAV